MKLAEILTGPETWCQGSLSEVVCGQVSKRCLIGGLLATMPDGSRYHDAAADRERCRIRRIIQELFVDLPEVNEHGDDPIAIWQDAPSRTWEDVAAVVDAYDRDRLLHP